MGRRDVDWSPIEADFRANILSERQIAEKHKVSYSALRAKAKRDGWTRDMTRVIDHATKSALVEKAKQKAQEKAQLEEKAQGEKAQRIGKAAEVATKKGAAEADAVISGVNAIVDQRVSVLTRHQESAAGLHNESARTLRDLSRVVEEIPSFKELADELRAAVDKAGEDAAMVTLAIRSTLDKLAGVLSLGGRADTLQRIAASMKTATEVERKAHGIADEEGGKKGIDTDEAILAMHNAMRAEIQRAGGEA